MCHRLTIAAGILAVCGPALAMPVPVRSSARKSFDAFKATTQAAFHACNQEVQSDKSLALGKCANVPDAAAAATCRDTAALDAKDASGECTDQRDARQAACAKLGPATYAPPIDPMNFTTTIDSPLFPLVPGTTFVYEGQTANGLEHDEFAVTHNTRVIEGVTCVEVHDVVTTAGVVTEDTRDWFAQDLAGNVWYFGELSEQLESGLIVGLEGSWQSGVDGASPGIVVVLSDNTTYPHCLKTTETAPIEPDALESKFYAPNVGNVLVIDVTAGERSDVIKITTGN